MTRLKTLTRELILLSGFSRSSVWDGVLPLVVLFIPYLVIFIPNIKQNTESFLLVISVIIIFLIRFSIGRKKISENTCGKIIQKFQHILFSIGVFYMLIIDALICTLAVVPRGEGGIKLEELQFIGLLVMPYFFLMSLAMYPGRTASMDEEKDYLDKDWAE